MVVFWMEISVEREPQLYVAFVMGGFGEHTPCFFFCPVIALCGEAEAPVASGVWTLDFPCFGKFLLSFPVRFLE